ncbi:hypothetical protein IW261DRAFT_1465477 [Armillaria novae-zelandiae]|uniref:Uncharacterized protein n=1 Tax=Armillaria novae-zelandiae TaxID=153914 RepID=A0AA39TEF7_9AGAR|nr:hypothetical protein IW261DRAFT_1465477 [Armillaria novae-zelandiae]
MARTGQKSQTRTPISGKSLMTKKAALAAKNEHRRREEEAALAASQQRRAERDRELKREADQRLKAVKAARHLIAINTEKPDLPPSGKATRKHNRRFNKQNQVQREAIEERNIFIQLAPNKSVRGAEKGGSVECNRCFRPLLGYPKKVMVVYRQMQPRSFLPPVHLKKMKMMGTDIGASEVLLANRYKDRVRLVATWYHLTCLSAGQVAHIRTHKAKWDKSVAEGQRKKIEQKYKFGIKEEGDVNEVDDVEVDRELDSSES